MGYKYNKDDNSSYIANNIKPIFINIFTSKL